MNRIWKAFASGVLGLAVPAFVALAADQPPLPKSGTALFDNPGHWHCTNYKTGDKRLGSSGEWWGMLVPKSESKFLKLADWQSVYGEQWNDFDKGIMTHIERGQILDGDKDAVFTSANCKLNSWSDWCVGTLEGGTGKYAGISGTIKWSYNPESSAFERTVPNGPHEVKARFDSAGESSLLVEISWKIP
jgi:hypothetical protein